MNTWIIHFIALSYTTLHYKILYDSTLTYTAAHLQHAAVTCVHAGIRANMRTHPYTPLQRHACLFCAKGPVLQKHPDRWWCVVFRIALGKGMLRQGKSVSSEWVRQGVCHGRGTRPAAPLQQIGSSAFFDSQACWFSCQSPPARTCRGWPVPYLFPCKIETDRECSTTR